MMKLSDADVEASRKSTRTWSHQSTLSSAAPASPTPAPSHFGRRLVAAVVLASLFVGGWFWFARNGDGPIDSSPSAVSIPAQYDADRAMGYLQRLCDFGPRPSGSSAMVSQQKYLKAFFADRGALVTMQSFDIRHPEDGSDVTMSNIIASWGSDRPKRYLLCAHYDTRPYPDQDRRNRRGVFVGANDGASGTAALMELSHQFGDGGLPSDVGVDVALFDGEEFVWQQGRDDYFLGSNFFAEKYKASPPSVPYQAGILLDMVGDRELKLFYEGNSMKFARDVAKNIWAVASDLRVDAFVPRIRHEIQDDHLPLNQIARIPTVDLIDFDYPRPGLGNPSYWHTEQDVPANCSGESMAAVVWVVHTFLNRQ
ncbi:Peptidase family M28 [Rubripirellula tenax]|uniref:Peptidase family M28 n=1 Tax=Rubripirellula tenax TaxID=2528015 RepID=A0A5C6EB90_9BACT|nr:M28 family peptidase [Rubripirellula tenax]TWU46242.1 Peptidase family M28 [Rubripirellula tenax]